MSQVVYNLVISLNKVGSVFYSYCAAVFVQTAVLILVLWVIDLLLHKRVRAAYRYCLWLLVLIKLVLPPTLSLPTGIGYWCGDHIVAAVPRSNPVLDTSESRQTNQLASQALLTLTGGLRVQPDQDSIQDDLTGFSTHSTDPSLTWQAVLFVLWCVGLFALLMLFVQRLRFVRGLVIAGRPGGEALSALLQQCQEQLGFRGTVRLKLSDTIPSPAVCGLVGPTILIPASLPEKLSMAGQRAVLLHELAHVKRGDLWINALQTVLQMIHFYHPLLWFANRRTRRICEQAVDEAVLVALGGQAQNYSKVLINISEMALWKADLGLRLVGVAESKEALWWRIRHMLARPIPKSTKLGLWGILSIVFLGAVLLPMARGHTNSPGDKAAHEPLTAVTQPAQKHINDRSRTLKLSDAQKQLVVTIAAANRANSRRLDSFEFRYKRTSKINLLRTWSGHYAYSKNRIYDERVNVGNGDSHVTIEAGKEIWITDGQFSPKFIVRDTHKHRFGIDSLGIRPWSNMESVNIEALDRLNSEFTSITSVREATVDNVQLVIIERDQRLASDPQGEFSHKWICHFNVKEGYLPVRIEYKPINASGRSIPGYIKNVTKINRYDVGGETIYFPVEDHSVFYQKTGQYDERRFRVLEKTIRINPDLPDDLFEIALNPGDRVKDKIRKLTWTVPAKGVVGAQAPDFTLDTLGGGRVALSKIAEDVVVLDFWHPRHSGCRMVRPILESVKKWAQDNNESVAFYSITGKEKTEDMATYLDEHDHSIPVLLDTDQTKVYKAYKGIHVPYIVVISDGVIKSVFVSANTGGLQGLQQHFEDMITAALED